MIKKGKCVDGCETQASVGEGICRRCSRAVEIEVESPAEAAARVQKENEEFFTIAEEARPRVLARFDSLDAGDKLRVMSYVGMESQARKINPFTPSGRAQAIFLMAEGLIAMVPEENRPWVVDGVVTDVAMQ